MTKVLPNKFFAMCPAIKKCNLIYAVAVTLILFFASGVCDAQISPFYNGTVETTAVAVSAGDAFEFACREDDVERQRIEIGVMPEKVRKIEWTLILSDSIGGHKVTVNTRLEERNKYDFDHEESIIVTLSVDENEVIQKDFGSKLPISKSPIYLRLMMNGSTLSLYAGDGELVYVGKTEFAGFFDKACVSSKYGIKVKRYSALYNPSPDIPVLVEDLSDLNVMLSKCKDKRCGIWEFFDEEIDTAEAVKGGRYRFALLPSVETGGYNLIYLSGAEIEPWRWKPGMKKGELIPTPFADNYTLIWTDSMGNKIDDLSPYVMFEGEIMTLVFPLQSARFRFVRPRVHTAL